MPSTTPQRSGGLIRHRMTPATSTEPAPADPSSSWLARPPGSRSVVLVRADDTEAAPDVQEAPEADEDAPATRADVAQLGALVAELLAREEARTAADAERAAVLDKLTDACLTLLQEIDALRQRFDRWDAEDEAAAY
jgi:hypothetical protein